jgi:hypothetical protein
MQIVYKIYYTRKISDVTQVSPTVMSFLKLTNCFKGFFLILSFFVFLYSRSDFLRRSASDLSGIFLYLKKDSRLAPLAEMTNWA